MKRKYNALLRVKRGYVKFQIFIPNHDPPFSSYTVTWNKKESHKGNFAAAFKRISEELKKDYEAEK